MKVKCINNTGEFLRSYEYDHLRNEMLGRFGTTENSQYNEITVGSEYLVMGIITFKDYQAYLIDDEGFISSCPCQLFEITDDKVDGDWCFRLIDKEEDIYPFVQAITGYPELCSDKNAYKNLIVEKDEEAERIYFKRKIESENSLA